MIRKRFVMALIATLLFAALTGCAHSMPPAQVMPWEMNLRAAKVVDPAEEYANELLAVAKDEREQIEHCLGTTLFLADFGERHNLPNHEKVTNAAWVFASMLAFSHGSVLREGTEIEELVHQRGAITMTAVRMAYTEDDITYDDLLGFGKFCMADAQQWRNSFDHFERLNK